MLLPTFVQQYRPTFPVGWGTRDPVYTFLSLPVMKTVYVPIMVFIDRKFQIRGLHTGDSQFFRNETVNIRNTVEALLKEPGGRIPARKKK